MAPDAGQRGDRGDTPGRADNPTLTFRCRFDDWVDVVAGRADPRMLMLRGRLRPRGTCGR